MQIIPKVSSVFRKKHSGKVAISLDGKILGLGKDSTEALKKAKKVLPEIEDKEFLISHIHHGVLIF